jgi:hypothetical protein
MKLKKFDEIINKHMYNLKNSVIIKKADDSDGRK